MRSQEKTPLKKEGTAKEQEAKRKKRSTPPLKKEGERERKVKSQEKTPPKRFRMKEVKPYLWSIVVKSGLVDLCSHPKHSAN